MCRHNTGSALWREPKNPKISHWRWPIVIKANLKSAALNAVLSPTNIHFHIFQTDLWKPWAWSHVSLSLVLRSWKSRPVWPLFSGIGAAILICSHVKQWWEHYPAHRTFKREEKQQHKRVVVIHTSVMQPYASARLVVYFGQLSSDDSVLGLV